MKRFFIFSVFSLLFSGSVLAQNKAIQCTITDATGPRSCDGSKERAPLNFDLILAGFKEGNDYYMLCSRFAQFGNLINIARPENFEYSRWRNRSTHPETFEEFLQVNCPKK